MTALTIYAEPQNPALPSSGFELDHQHAALVITDAPLEVVRGAVKARLSAFKLPTRWLLLGALDDVPLLGSGKVDKAALQKLLASEGSVAA